MEALMRDKFFLLVRLLCILTAISLAAEARAAQRLAQTPSQQYGCAVKRPILGAACPFCPWGALADEVKEAMKPLGYDVQICPQLLRRRRRADSGRAAQASSAESATSRHYAGAAEWRG